MALSEFLPFAWHAAANVMTNAQWQANPAALNGFSAGIARSRECNKAWRQAINPGSALAQLIPQILDEDALDNGDMPRLSNQIERLIGAIANLYIDVKEAPLDSLTYGRRNAAWTRVPSWDDLQGLNYIADAPAGAWYVRTAGSWGDLNSILSAYGYITDAPAGAWHVRHAGAWLDVNALGFATQAWVQNNFAGLTGAYLPLTGGTLQNPGTLDVRADAYANNFHARNGITINGSWVLFDPAGNSLNVTASTLYCAGTMSSGSCESFGFHSIYTGGNTGGVGCYWLTANNRVESPNWITTSDPSVKRDIRAIASDANALDYVKRLQPVFYHWRDDPEGRLNWGFLAPDVRAVMGDDFAGYYQNPESGLQGINYNDLFAVLWSGVQQLTARVETLEGRG